MTEGALAADSPGTLNFHNVTATRMMPTTTELPNNAKEVEQGDFDEDGDLDVVIANAYSDFGARKNKLYRNDAGSFQEITTSGAIPGFVLDQVSRNAFFRDFNGDGHLDIYIVNDGNSDPDQLFLATWSGGAFDHYEESFNFVVNGSTNTGASYGGWSADFDQDGEDDIYLGNDPNTAQDRLLLGLGSGSFVDVTATNLPAAIDYTVDVCGADLNGDGNRDLLLSTSHSWDENKIYYNNLGLGGDPGSFTYPGSVQFLGNPSVNLNAMEAGDFDGDGDQDIYWSDGAGSTTDLVLRNDGNDASGKATLTTLTALPASVAAVTSRKATVADLNNDGRLDILVMKETGFNSRPTILRNVTVGNAIEFADWTPAPAFPTGNSHKGWHAAVFDSNGDGDLDIFMGGWSGDHLFEQEPGAEYSEGDLAGGVIPNVFNGDPAAVVGTVGSATPDTYTINALTGSAFLSVVLNGADDYQIEILDGAGAVLASVDRGGLGVEEAITFDPVAMPATATLRVTALACAGPNVSGDCGVGISDFLDLLGAWGPNPGHPADLDGDNDVGVTDLWLLLCAWGDSTYILEVLARDG